MPRSFLVDSLVLREAGEKKGEGSPPPPLFPYAVHPSHPLPGLPAGACHARKAGLLCVCPLCVTASQLHPPPPAIPLIKASFPPFGSQYCHSPLARQQHSVSAVSVGHAPALYQGAYPLPDPRQFHCISVGKAGRGGQRGVHACKIAVGAAGKRRVSQGTLPNTSGEGVPAQRTETGRGVPTPLPVSAPYWAGEGSLLPAEPPIPAVRTGTGCRGTLVGSDSSPAAACWISGPPGTGKGCGPAGWVARRAQRGLGSARHCGAGGGGSGRS